MQGVSLVGAGSGVSALPVSALLEMTGGVLESTLLLTRPDQATQPLRLASRAPSREQLRHQPRPRVPEPVQPPEDVAREPRPVHERHIETE